jgi:hypothetical protein
VAEVGDAAGDEWGGGVGGVVEGWKAHG